MAPAILLSDTGTTYTIKPEDVGASYDIDKTVAAAQEIGRSSSFFTSLIQRLTTPLLGYDLAASVKVDDAKFTAHIETITKELTTSEKDAGILIKDGVVTITPASVGQAVKTTNIKEQVLERLGSKLNTDPIKLVTVRVEPTIKEPEAETAKAQATLMIGQQILATYNDQTYVASPATIGSWLEAKVVKEPSPSLTMIVSEQKINAYIASIATKIDTEPQDARLAVVDGQVKITTSSKDGLKVNRDKARADIINLIDARKGGPVGAAPEVSPTPSAAPSPIATNNNQVVLSVDIKRPEVTDDNIQSIGIKERIAISETDFKGSPANRSENIKLGTKLFNGIILKPGAQFSAVKSLGRIDESAGFKPELVIKEDQLVPEVGGGLCQVSTTLFRAAMNAGLQVDERRNHRFRVSYYEAKVPNPHPEDYVTINAKTLVGLDATIYDPSPDFKFTNDTGNYVLIQGKVEGTRLTFELFGTKDGRSVAIDGPYITATIPAPTEIQYIDDPTLPAGVTKTKEKAVAGSKTTATYTVTKDGKQLHKNTFTSSYVPWQRKDYRGTGPAASPSPAAPAAATPTPEAVASIAPTPAP
jgi:vancomycin resistance protein YoaR